MSFRTRTKWLAAIFFIALIVLLFWKFKVLKTPKSVPIPVSAKNAQTPSDHNLGAVSRVPLLVPGDTCAKADKTLGKPMEEDKYSRSWKSQDFFITASIDSDCHLTGVGITVLEGHKGLTVDGVTLGSSTLADAEKMLGKRLTEGSESVEAGEGHWAASLELNVAAGMPYSAAYRAYMADDKAEAMNRYPIFSDFRDLPITQYSLKMVSSQAPAK